MDWKCNKNVLITWVNFCPFLSLLSLSLSHSLSVSVFVSLSLFKNWNSDLFKILIFKFLGYEASVHVITCVTHDKLCHVTGSLRAIWLQGALPEGVRVQDELQRPRCHQVGQVHRAQRAVRDQVLRRLEGLMRVVIKSPSDNGTQFRTVFTCECYTDC